MLDDFSSDKIFMQMEAKKAAVQAISDTKKQLELAKEELKNAERALSDVDKAERMALSDLGNVGPIRKFFSTLFKRGKYYEYQQRSKELSTQHEKAKTVVDEARRNVSDAESKHDEAIKTNDNTKDASKVYEKTDKGLLITDVSLEEETVDSKKIPSSQKVFVHCTDFFPHSGEIVSSYDGGKILEGKLDYHGVVKKLSTISNRHEVHVTQNNRVESTGDGLGNWDSVKFIVVDNYEGIEDDIESGDSSDSWTKGTNIKLSPKAVVLVREDALDEISPEDRENLKIVLYRGKPTRCLRNFLIENGYSIAATNSGYTGHRYDLRSKVERTENIRNMAIHFVTNEPVLTQGRPVVDESQIGAIADVYISSKVDEEAQEFFRQNEKSTVIDFYMEKCGLAPEDRKALTEVLNFVVLTGLKKTDDGKSYTFKSSEEIIDEMKFCSGRMNEMSSPNISHASPELVLEVFRQRQKAQMKYSQLEAPSIESVQEMSTSELFDFKNQKAAEVASKYYKGIDKNTRNGNYP